MENPIENIEQYPIMVVLEEFDGTTKRVGLPSISLGDYSNKLRSSILFNMSNKGVDITTPESILEIECSFTEYFIRNINTIGIGFATPDDVDTFNNSIDFIAEFK